jgi:hypothetical protein
MSLLNVRSYSSSHHTCHHTSPSVNFFFIIITLVAVCCYTTLVVLWDCYGLVCWFISLCDVMKLRIKKSSRTFVIPARTSLRSHAPAFMSPPRGISPHVSSCASVEERLAHRYARTRRATPLRCCLFFFFFFLSDIGQVLPHAIAS